MAHSTGRELHIDRHLTNLAINYRPQNMIADLIAPIVPVAKESDIYPVFSRFEAFAVEETSRSRGQEARKVTRSVSSANYVVKNYALGHDVFLEDTANMDDALRFELDEGASRYVQNKLALDYEKRVLTLAVQTTAVGTVFVCNSSIGVTGANAGDPFVVLQQAKETMKQATGQEPNRIVFGWRAWNLVARNYHMRNLIKGVNNGGGIVTRQGVADLLELDQLLVAEAMWQSANEAQTAVFSLYNPLVDQAIMYYAPSAPSRDDPSWMYSFRWQAAGLPAPMVVERHPYDSRKKMETIEAGYWQDERIVGTDYGARILLTVASGAAGLGG